MREVSRKYNYQLTTLTPLHIGTGEVMTPLEYLIGDDLVVPELDRVFTKYPAAAEHFARNLAGASAEKLARVGLDQLIDSKVVGDPEVCRYKIAPFIFKENSFDSLNALDNCIEAGQANIKLAIKTPDNRVYVPGSSLKGAFKTAWLYQQCRQVPNLVDQVAEKAWHTGENAADAFLSSRVLHPKPQPGDEQRKIRRERDAAFDVFRALQISDSGTLPSDDTLTLIAEDVLSAPIKTGNKETAEPAKVHAGFKNYPIFLEAIDERLSFTGRLLFAQGLLNGQPANRVMGWNDVQSSLTLEKLCAAVNQFAADLCQWEIEYFERLAAETKNCDCDDVLNFYDDLKAQIETVVQSESSSACYFSLGHGSGWHKLTIGLLLEKKLEPAKFLDLRERLNLAPRHIQFEFPKSRKLVMSGRTRAYAPFGWVKMGIAPCS
ncbi:MAG: type III-A CRISPR-associated RAMP protein Csm5 [Acidobacteria bacterium]|nr:type III-A CRISPR-associated RAMP protein Csm5 [Acidobacteriota bacterium]